MPDYSDRSPFAGLSNASPMSEAFEPDTMRFKLTVSDALIDVLTSTSNRLEFARMLIAGGIAADRRFYFARDQGSCRWLVAQPDRPPERVVHQAMIWRWTEPRFDWAWTCIPADRLPILAACVEISRQPGATPHRPPMLRPILAVCASQPMECLYWVGACQRCCLNYWSEGQQQDVPSSVGPAADFRTLSMPVELSTADLRGLLQGNSPAMEPPALAWSAEGVLRRRYGGG